VISHYRSKHLLKDIKNEDSNVDPEIVVEQIVKAIKP